MHLMPPPDKLPECIHISDFHSLTRKDLRELKEILVVGERDTALVVVVPFAMYMATQKRLVELLCYVEELGARHKDEFEMYQAAITIKDNTPSA